MREITYDQIVSAVRSLCITANTVLPADLCQAIRTAREEEVSPVGQAILGDLEENFTFAGARGLPICQDTGMAVVFVRLGQEVRITGGRCPGGSRTFSPYIEVQKVCCRRTA